MHWALSLLALSNAKRCLLWRFVSQNWQYLWKKFTQTKIITDSRWPTRMGWNERINHLMLLPLKGRYGLQVSVEKSVLVFPYREGEKREPTMWCTGLFFMREYLVWFSVPGRRKKESQPCDAQENHWGQKRLKIVFATLNICFTADTDKSFIQTKKIRSNDKIIRARKKVRLINFI